VFKGVKNIVKMSTLSKVNYRFNAITTKILMSLFIKIEKNIKICMEPQKRQNSKNKTKKGPWTKKEQNWKHHPV
jgi:hypothetical protein